MDALFRPDGYSLKIQEDKALTLLTRSEKAVSVISNEKS
jgi:hypothetical protein